ncbi:MAG: DUF1304 domain-containing protein [Candidatus Nomurabacteria bacterium]|nr:DUF1304 domain-containing protein [Candidatus Nomurabacteria bacterium]USN87757.1 MAG: DUF1304 domain-containing protein [Candidatus Nomurabacteria bacterium]
MESVPQVLIGLVAITHLYFFWFEFFGWSKAITVLYKQELPEIFQLPTKVLMTNQGLYNGFLAAGLIWTFFISDPLWHTRISVFFLVCVIVAGTFGAMSLGKRVFMMQALPAILALAAIWYL